MIVDPEYKTAIKIVQARLSKHGFKARGKLSYRHVNDAWQGISFQKSTSSTLELALFRVNVGISLDIVRQEMGWPVKLNSAHLGHSVRSYSPASSDWWAIAAHGDGEKVGSEVADLLETEAVPFLDKYCSSKAVANAWRSGNSLGSPGGNLNLFLRILDDHETEEYRVRTK